MDDNNEYKEAFSDCLAHLIAIASAYEKYGRQHKVRGPADPFFTTRLKDANKSIERARDFLKKLCQTSLILLKK